MREYTFDLTFAGLSDYITQRHKVMANSVAEAFAKVLEYANGSLRNINLFDIY